MSKHTDLTGRKFGKLTVVERADPYIDSHGNKTIMYKCKCDCGNECVVRGAYLRMGRTSSCGCYKKEVQKDPFTTLRLPNKYRTRDGYGVCFASNTGDEILFDLEDFSLIKNIRWYIGGNSKKEYKSVCGIIDGKVWFMHRYLMKDQLADGLFIDHKNRNPFDNRRSNLRLCNNRENSCNLKPKNRLGVKGVCFITRNKFEAKIQGENGRLHLGVFDTMKEATDVYDKKAQELFGEFAYLNNYKGVNVVSINDGISCGLMALKSIYGMVNEYHSYETNEYAINTSLLNYPDIFRHGDIKDENFYKYDGIEIDYLIGKGTKLDYKLRDFFGRLLIKGDGALEFQQFIKARDYIKPHFVIFEINTRIPKRAVKWISDSLGFDPVIIDSKIVSAQKRKRYYWVGIRNNDGTYRRAEIIKTHDKKIKFIDAINGLTDRDKSRTLQFNRGFNTVKSYFEKRTGNLVFEPVDIVDTVESVYSKADDKKYPVFQIQNKILKCGDAEYPIQLNDGNYIIRNLTVDECKRLQNIPDSYKFMDNSIKTLKLLADSSTIGVLQILIFSILRNQ